MTIRSIRSGLATGMTAAATALWGAFDLNDVFFIAGLALAVWGGSLISFRWTLVIVGVALAVIGLVGFGGSKVRR